MTRSTPSQVAFSAGEISPRLHQRVDYQRFQTGLRACNGFLPMRQGAVMRAPGTLFWGHTREQAACRLISFEFNAEDAVLLEFYPNVMRVRRYGSYVLAGGGQPYEMAHPYNASALARLSWVQSADVIYIADGALPIHRLSRFALDNWEIEPQEIRTGPFRPRNVDTNKSVIADGERGEVTLSANFDLFTAAHEGSLFSLEPVDYPDLPQWTQDTDVTPEKTRMRYDGRIYEVVEGTNTGFVPPQHHEGIQKTDHKTGISWAYISGSRGVVRITEVLSPTEAKAKVIERIPANSLESQEGGPDPEDPPENDPPHWGP